MDRTNIFAAHDDKTVVGWFDWDKIQAHYGDKDYNGNGSRGTARGTGIVLTAGGRWVSQYWTAWQGEHATFTYITPDEARDWLIANNEEEAIVEHFGGLPEEEDRRPGRPEIGSPVQVRLGDLLGQVDEWAAARAMTRAEAVRKLVEHGLRAGTSGFRPRDRVSFEVEGEQRQGWYVSQFGHNVSTVTLVAPEDWIIREDGKPMPPVYTRSDDEIIPAR